MIAQLYDCFKHWATNGTVWIISDPHFRDEELRAGIPGRPTDAQIISNIKKCVGSKDTLICLGDVGDVTVLDYSFLNVYKVLIMGNHDRGGYSAFVPYFNEVYAGPLMISPRIMLSHQPVPAPYWFNIHGHEHTQRSNEIWGLNACLDVTDYQPINLNQLIKNGALAKTPTIHRYTTDMAIKEKEFTKQIENLSFFG